MHGAKRICRVGTGPAGEIRKSQRSSERTLAQASDLSPVTASPILRRMRRACAIAILALVVPLALEVNSAWGGQRPVQSRIILLNRSIGDLHLGEARSSVEKTLGRGIASHGWVSYFGGHLLVDYVYKVEKTTHVEALVTRWRGFHTRSGVHVGSSVQDVRRRLHISCGGGSCTAGSPGRPSTILFTRRGKVARIEVLYLS